MREIKFRAWELCTKTMRSFDSLMNDGDYDAWQSIFFVLDRKDEYIPMQYTGLKDKNGKEIYEGDVISEQGAFVLWSDTLACWCFDFKSELHLNRKVPLYTEKEYEVLGNIYANPELLTNK